MAAGWQTRLRRRFDVAPSVLVFAQVVHVVGDTGIAVALGGTLYFDVPVEEARTSVALYLLLAFAPYAVLAPFVAPAVASRSRSHGAVVVLADVGRALVAVALIGRLDTALVYPAGFVVLVLSRTHALSRLALVPEMTGDERALLEANAAIGVASGIAGAVGGLVALAATQMGGPDAALVVSAVVFGVGSVGGLWLSPPRGRSPVRRGPGWLTDPESLRITVAVVAGRVAVGFVVVFVAFAFHGSDDVVPLAVAVAALGLGTWLASVITPRLRGIVAVRPLAEMALAGLVVAAAVAAVTGGLVRIAVLAGAVGLLAAVLRLCFDVHVQSRWAPAARGPGYARYETLLQLGWVVGAALGSLLVLSPLGGALVVAAVAVGGLVTDRWVAHATPAT